ncbi:hypothetical protein HOG48_01860 [Candidatus Peregrinibacteria bacterium]|nr:hypothetical protein [Candidatus Peregrinibacteria bacterium]
MGEAVRKCGDEGRKEPCPGEPFGLERIFSGVKNGIKTYVDNFENLGEIARGIEDIIGEKFEDFKSIEEFEDQFYKKIESKIDTLDPKTAIDALIFFLPILLLKDPELHAQLEEGLSIYFDEDDLPITKKKLEKDVLLAAKIDLAKAGFKLVTMNEATIEGVRTSLKANTKFKDDTIEKMIDKVQEVELTDEQIIRAVNIITGYPEANDEFADGAEKREEKEKEGEEDHVIEVPDITAEDIARADKRRKELEGYKGPVYIPTVEIPKLDPEKDEELDPSKLPGDEYARIRRIAEWLNKDTEDYTGEDNRNFIRRKLSKNFHITEAIPPNTTVFNDNLEDFLSWWNGAVETYEDLEIRNREEARLVVNMMCGVYPGNDPWGKREQEHAKWEETSDTYWEGVGKTRQDAEDAEIERLRKEEEERLRKEKEERERREREERARKERERREREGDDEDETEDEDEDTDDGGPSGGDPSSGGSDKTGGDKDDKESGSDKGGGEEDEDEEPAAEDPAAELRRRREEAKAAEEDQKTTGTPRDSGGVQR